MTSRLVCLAALLGAVTFPSTRIALAQAPDCTYDRCALRIQSRLFSERVVAGISATPVAYLGMFGARIEPLSTANDSSRVHYQAFRAYQSRGGGFTLVSIVTLIAFMGVGLTDVNTLDEERRRDNLRLGLAGVGMALSLVGSVNTMNARDQLHRAIWFYNRSLSAGP